MSNKTNVTLILDRLHNASDIIAEAFENGRIYATEDNIKKITLLVQQRILTADIHDSYQLRYSMRQFLNLVLNTNKIMDSNTDFSISFNRLDDFVNRHNDAFAESRDEDRDYYHMRIRDSVNDIAGSIADELLHISGLIDSQFATVSTLSEKMKENDWYMTRAKSILDLLETFSFSDIEQRLLGHHDLTLTFNLLLKSRMPEFIETFRAILEKLDKYKYEFRKIEAQAKLLRKFSHHLSRYPDWSPNDWSSNEKLEDWMSIAEPLTLSFSPSVESSDNEKMLVDIAINLPAFKGFRPQNKKRSPGVLIDMGESPVIKFTHSGIQIAVNHYLEAVLSAEKGISARSWWLNNPALLEQVSEEYWLHRILSEKQNRKIGSKIRIDLVAKMTDDFDGNVRINDLIATKGYAIA